MLRHFAATTLPGLFARTGLIVFAALLFGVILPLTVNHFAGTLNVDGVRKRITPAASSELLKFELAQDTRKRALRAVEDRLLAIATAKQQEPVSELLRLRDHLEKALQQKPPLVLSGYYLDDSMPLWPLYYTGLGLLVFNLAPRTRERQIRFLAFIGLWSVLVLVQRTPTWFRNTPLGQLGRKVYAYSNFDVSVPAFVMQEALGLGLCCLITVTWLQWFAFYDQRDSELQRLNESPVSESGDAACTIDARRVHLLQDTFLHWQFSSLALLIAFLYSTFFFWNRVAHDADSRYIPAAIVTHFLWVATWTVVSAPLFITWRDWTRHRVTVTTTVAQAGTKENSEKMLELFDRLRPVSFWNLTSSTVLAVASLLFPIVHSLR